MNVPQHNCPPVKDLVHPETDERAEMTLCDYEQAGGNLRRLQAQRYDDHDLVAAIEQHKTSLTINRYQTIAERLGAVDDARGELKKAEENLAAGVFSALEEDVRVVDIAERLGISRWSVYRLSDRGDESGISISGWMQSIDLDDIEGYNYEARKAETDLWKRIAEAREAGATYNDLRVVSGHTAETIRSHLRRRQTKGKDDPD